MAESGWRRGGPELVIVTPMNADLSFGGGEFEQSAAWRTILEHGGPAAQPEAMRLLAQLPDQPEPLTWSSVQDIARRYDSLDYTRQWTDGFRRNYHTAEKLALKKR